MQEIAIAQRGYGVREWVADETKRGDRDVPFDRWAGGDAKSLRAASQTARTYLQ